MPRIKICGLTRPQDVTAAARLGADMLGFIMAPSPRRITLEQLKKLVAGVPAYCLTVAVMVNPSRREVEDALEFVDRVQFHGEEPPDFCRPYRRRAIKAFRVSQSSHFEAISLYQDAVSGYLLDSYVKGQAGGTGRQFAWELLEGREFARPVLLAGGINEENVVGALRVRPVWGVDVSSGVESAPGTKDAEKMTQLFRAAGRIA